MSPQSIEFIDYIFDRYAYLGVAEDATTEEIRQAVRKQRAENHSDKLTNVSADILALATRARGFIDECARVLLDDTLRVAFDERLQQFRTQSGHLVSTSGIPIIDPMRFRVDLDYLLKDETFDVSELERRISTMAGFDAKRLSRAKARYAKDPLDWELREDVRSELTSQFVYLTLLEDVYWMRAGVAGAASQANPLRAQTPEHLTTEFKLQLEHVRAKAEQQVEQQHGLSLLGFAPPLQLTYAGVLPAGEGAVVDRTALVRKALASFEERAAALQAVVEQKKNVATELVAVRRAAQVRPDSATQTLDIVYIKRSDSDADIVAWPPEQFELMDFGFRLLADGGMSELAELPTIETLGSWPHGLVLLEVNHELPGPLMEVIAEGNDWLARREAQVPSPSA